MVAAEEFERVRKSGMPQDRASGAEASQFGHECGARVAIALGTRLRSGASNECQVNGERVVIKCARRGNNRVGVSYNMLTNLDAVLGAFQEPNGLYQVLRLPAQRCATLMQQSPTASRGPSSGRVGMVNRAVFEQEGTPIGVVRI